MPDLWANDAFIASIKENQNQKTHPTEFSKMMYNYGRLFLVNKLLDPQKGEIILDIGCADGFFLHQHQDLIVPVGIDISNRMIRKARKNVIEGEFLLSTMENLPFRDGTFDKIVAVYSFIYSENKQNALTEISRVLKNGGSFIVFDPNKLSSRTIIRVLQVIKFRLMGKTDNPRYLHHRFVVKNALSYGEFKKMGRVSDLVLQEWAGIFSLHLIIQSISFHAILDTMKYTKWGSYSPLKYLSDFFIIRYKKM
jgi:ubiquinone/menaquinone biosynthesis C-methylase UbiE